MDLEIITCLAHQLCDDDITVQHNVSISFEPVIFPSVMNTPTLAIVIYSPTQIDHLPLD